MMAELLSDDEVAQAIWALFVAVGTLHADLFTLKDDGGNPLPGSQEDAAVESLRFLAGLLPDGHPIRRRLLNRANGIDE